MDKIDIGILQQLDNNVRISSRQIGKTIKKSKETINYRLNQLINNKIITSFFAVINGARLGFIYHKILIKYQNLNIEKEKEMINYLIKSKNIVWVGKCDGNWNLMLTTISKNLKDFNKFYNNFIERWGEFFLDKEILQITIAYLFNDKFLYENKEFRYSLENDLTVDKINYDKNDLIIMGLLSQNSRINYTKIANKLNLSSEAVSNRIKQLFKNKIIIGYKPRLNFSRLGYNYFHIFLSVKEMKNKSSLISYYKNHFGCITILEHIGKYDLQLEFVLKSIDELRNVVDDLRNRFGKILQNYIPLTIYQEYSINIFPKN
ncbi:Lrp/AsnC family transcriptional regulator [Candidatus Woesearchaeota archaeon]|nr:Lrp/AsnC family transcriptional regulator [Candidatus Woesearchaeota archaeon]